MLRVIARSENFEIDSRELYYQTRESVDTEEYLRAKNGIGRISVAKRSVKNHLMILEEIMRVISKLKKRQHDIIC